MLYYVDPSIELTLESGPVSVEGLAVLICTINGVSEVHNFTWYHNGELRLEAGIDISIEHLGTVGKLSIHDIAIEEAGNYTCIAHTPNSTIPLQESIMLRLQGKTIHAYVYIAACMHGYNNYVCSVLFKIFLLVKH